MDIETGNDGENIEHLETCPGCPTCDYLVDFYQTCDNCGKWGNMVAMEGVVEWLNGIGTATVLCSPCMDKYEKDPESVYLIPRQEQKHS